MPELPEVESIKLQLSKYVVGHKIEAVDVRNQKIFQGKTSDVVGAKIKEIRRFAKVQELKSRYGRYCGERYTAVVHVLRGR